MSKYSAIITVTIDEFEAHSEEHAEDISSIFTRRILDAELVKNSDIKINVQTFIKEEKTFAQKVADSVDQIVDIMNSGKVNPKQVYPSNRYHGD